MSKFIKLESDIILNIDKIVSIMKVQKDMYRINTNSATEFYATKKDVSKILAASAIE